MSFNYPEDIPRGVNRKVIPEAGEPRIGVTWSDGTVLYEVVPEDAYEMILRTDFDFLKCNSKFSISTDFIGQNHLKIMAMQLLDFFHYIYQYITKSEMRYLTVGGAATQLDAVREFGNGQPVLRDIYGDELNM